MSDSINLAHLPRELAALTGRQPPSYRSIYSRVVDGAVPEAAQHNGRWFVQRADLPQIAKRFGLITTPQQKAA